MMLVSKIINSIGCILCIFAAHKFARDDNVCMPILFCIFTIVFWLRILA